MGAAAVTAKYEQTKLARRVKPYTTVYRDTEELLQAFRKLPKNMHSWDLDEWWQQHTEPGLARKVAEEILYKEDPHRHWWMRPQSSAQSGTWSTAYGKVRTARVGTPRKVQK